MHRAATFKWQGRERLDERWSIPHACDDEHSLAPLDQQTRASSQGITARYQRSLSFVAEGSRKLMEALVAVRLVREIQSMKFVVPSMR